MTDAPTAVLSAEISADPSKLIDGFQKAEQATGAWAKAAARNMQTAQASFGGLDFTVVTSKARAEQIKMIELQHQLDVARASGEKETVRALTDEISLLQRVRQLRSVGFKPEEAHTAATAQMSALSGAAGNMAGSLNRSQILELQHVAKSLFDQISAGASPMRALQVEGGRIAQVFGEGEGGVSGTFKALTGLINPMTVGIGGAAIAFIALVAVMGRVHEAAQEIVDLKVSGDKLGIPVEELQMWQFIAAQTHVSNQQLDQSFTGLTATLGKLKSGIREQRIQPFIEELGISDADIAKANNAADLMGLIMSKMDKIKDPGERTQIADAFGMQSALPLLSRTREEIQGMSDDFARNAGVISGPQAEALDKQEQALNRAHALMHDKIRADLAELAPALGGLAVAWDQVGEAALGALTDMVRAASFKPGQGPATPGVAGAAGGLGHVVGGLVGGAPGAAAFDYVNQLVAHLITPIPPHPPAVIPHSVPTTGGGPTGGQITRATEATDAYNKALEENVTHTKHATDAQKLIDDANKARAAAGQAPLPKAQTDRLLAAARAQDAKPGEAAARRGEAVANKALEENKASDDAISAAKLGELKARVAVTADLAADHQIRLSELQNERNKANADLAVSARQGKISAGAAATATRSNNGAYDDKVALENQKYQDLIADSARQYFDDLGGYQVAHLRAMAEIATTADEQAADLKKAFAAQQVSERDDFASKNQKRVTSLGSDHLTQGQANTELGKFDAGQSEALAANNRAMDQAALQVKKAYTDQLAGYTESSLQSEAALALTTKQRVDIERRLLEMRQAQARKALEDQIAAPGFKGDATQLRQGLQTQQAGETKVFNQDNLSPWGKWADEGEKAAADVGEEMQSAAVKSLDQLNSGLADAIANGKNMGDVFKSVFRQMESDALSYLLKQAEIGIIGGGPTTPGAPSLLSGLGALFGSAASLGSGSAKTPDLTSSFSALDAATKFIPAFATGSDDTPGGETLYNEKGTEGYVPPGAQIIPNSTLQGLAQLTPDKLGAGGGTVNHNIKIDLTGANGDEAINRAVVSAARQAYTAAVATGRSDAKRSQQSSRQSLLNH